MPKLHEKPSALKSEHAAVESMKILVVFLPSWIRVRHLYADPDQDPTAQINADSCGSGYRSETLNIRLYADTVPDF
jgi:hypothetical protein